MNLADVGFKILLFTYTPIKFLTKLFKLSEPQVFSSVVGQLLWGLN